MRRFVLALAAAIVGVVRTTFADGFFYGENLLLEPPSALQDWDVMSKDEGKQHAQVWIKKGTEPSEMVMVQKMNGAQENLEAFRQVLDASDTKNCDSFKSSVLESTPRNGYPRIAWRTTCEHVGEQARVTTTFQIAIQGQDSLYHIMQVFRTQLSDSEFASRTAQLAAASVCDSRLPDRACPKGFQRVK